MREYQLRQARNLVSVLKEQHLDQKSFAEMFHFSRTSVNDWVNGKKIMSESRAKSIHDKWPQYPVDWLRGYTEARNEAEQFELELFDEINKGRNMAKSVAILGHFRGGFDFDSRWEFEDNWPTAFVEVKRKKESVTLSAEEWNAFVCEVSDYISMRLNSMIERGGW